MAALLLSSFSTLWPVGDSMVARIWCWAVAGWLGLCAVAAADPLSDAVTAMTAGRYDAADALAGAGLAAPGLDALTRDRLLVTRGLARQAQGRADDALADFTQALSDDALPRAERMRALFDRGVTLDGLDRLDDALGDYDAAIRLDANASFALNNRANIYRRQGRLDEARRDYLAAAAIPNANLQYPYYGLGQIAEALGDTAAARDDYRKALAADPGYQLAADRLAALDGAPGGAADQPIVLHPPPPRTLVLHPPPPEKPMVPVAATSRHPPPPPPEDAPLRPAIMDRPASGGLVQLGAWRSQGEAQQGWTKAQARAGGLLDGLTPRIEVADLPGRGRYYRLRVRPQGQPAQFCATLSQAGLACIPVRD